MNNITTRDPILPFRVEFYKLKLLDLAFTVHFESCADSSLINLEIALTYEANVWLHQSIKLALDQRLLQQMCLSVVLFFSVKLLIKFFHHESKFLMLLLRTYISNK